MIREKTSLNSNAGLSEAWGSAPNPEVYRMSHKPGGKKRTQTNCLCSYHRCAWTGTALGLCFHRALSSEPVKIY